MTRRMLVTSALPYANGSIHLGHLVEYVLTDIWVRYLKLRGYDARYFCADDTHGTPVMIRAMQEKIDPVQLIERMQQEHLRDFTDFGIAFDNFHSTHSPENERWAQFIYGKLKEGGFLARRDVEQFYCPQDELFLPDRLIRGGCPRCSAEDQYGDSCEVCSAAYDTTELRSPACSICGTTPVRRSSEHIFVRLAEFSEMLADWTRGHLQKEVANYVGRWIEGGLRDWDISRDAPYFGFPIPGEQDKYFYVWLDAPIGYIASSDDWCRKVGRDPDEFWRDPAAEVHHIIGKDILYFHTLFWPAMLHAAGLNLPTSVHVHGFLRVEGEKMSKSRGTFINARTYLDHLDPQYLRYYYAAKLSDSAEDIDLVFEDFVNRVNAELVNKVVNLFSRTLKFVESRLDGRLSTIADDARPLVDEAIAAGEQIAAAYERRDLAAAVARSVQIAEQGNLYLQSAEPWKAAQDDPERARAICTAAANLGRIVAIYLKPVVPELVARIERMLGSEQPLVWDDLSRNLENRSIGTFERLLDRIDRKSLTALVEAARAEFAQASQPADGPATEPAAALAPQCTIDDFARVDLRVARITAAEVVPKAKKLLRLQLDLGPLGQRSVFAGVRPFYPEPGALVGRLVVCVANLQPRQMKLGLSEGMVCASGSAPGAPAERVQLLWADEAARPGDRVS